MTCTRPLLVIGTRPEAIKMAPVVAACRAHSERASKHSERGSKHSECGSKHSEQIEPIVCFTGQHDEMLRQVTDYFGIRPDFDLKVMSPGQSLAQLTAKLIVALDETMEAARPDWVVAQGDTTSVLAASLAAFYRRIPFVHVEGGLRTHNLAAPWPEEFNRRAASISTELHCAPTAKAAENLRREGIPAHQIRVTGNTVIDALLETQRREHKNDALWNKKHDWLGTRELVLVTVHRRENHGPALQNICDAIALLAGEFPRTAFLLPVHLNPRVQEIVRERLAGIDNLRLTPPLAYPEFVWLMQRAKLIVSDSGGIQEEAPSLKRPVVALREDTERGEAVDCGAVVCVGADTERICATVRTLLSDSQAYAAMQIEHSPFGDGHAAERIVEWLLEPYRS
jgi:UDP-N-acetylglucosamine 2-epimerase (non-hydrolysing)